MNAENPSTNAENQQSTPPEEPKSSPQIEASDSSTDYTVHVFCGIVGLFVLISWIGWTRFFTIVLWLAVAIGALAAVAFGFGASEAKEEDDKIGLWVCAAFSAVFACLAWWFIPSGSAPSKAPPQTGGAIQGDQAGSLPQSHQARQTLAYWNGLRSALVRLSNVKARNLSECVNLLNSVVWEIDRLSAVGVDGDAIRCGLALRELLATLAHEAQRRNSPEIFIEAFARGYQGDVFGPSLEILQRNTAIRQMCVDLQSQCASTRTVLSSRYHIEFPPL